MKERNLETLLTQKIKNMGGLCWKFVSPGIVGVPDRICILDGRVVFVEVKTTGRKPRPNQQRRIQQLRDQGIPVFVVDGMSGVEEVLHALSAA